MLEARSKYETKKNIIEIKIIDNERQVDEVVMGKKSFSALGTSEELKYKLEV